MAVKWDYLSDHEGLLRTNIYRELSAATRRLRAGEKQEVFLNGEKEGQYLS